MAVVQQWLEYSQSSLVLVLTEILDLRCKVTSLQHCIQMLLVKLIHI
jgi:hypothetical protein